MEFSVILRRLRKEREITQTELGKNLNYTPSTISDWENERSEPSIVQLRLVADFFGCTIDYLVGREDDFGNITATAPSSDLSEDEKKLVTLFRSMNATRRATVLDTVEGLADLDLRKKYISESSKP